MTAEARREGVKLYRALEHAGCEPRWVDGFRAIEALCPAALREGQRVTMRLEYHEGEPEPAR